MNVDIDQARVHLQMDSGQRIPVNGQQRMVALQNSLNESIIANIPSINQRRDSESVRPRPFRQRNEPGQRIIQCLPGNGNHFLGCRTSIDGCDDLQQITVAQRPQQRVAVMLKGESYFGVCERQPVHEIRHVA
ncbi:Uncharacterised protein [Chlamydia abortus]|nr:Uncharacterised protein [Chlamydia abortus]